MQHFYSLDEINRANFIPTHPIQDTLVAIGAFDGVHLGHQAILIPMVEQARKAGVLSVVVTFHPHPAVVLRGIDNPIYLTSPEERTRLLGNLGIDIVITMNFNRAVANLTADEFMQKITAALKPKEIWAGYDFTIGRNRQGNTSVLQSIGERLGYNMHIVHEISSDGRISSSRIRDYLRGGKASETSQLLGRPYSVEGPVIHGDGRGRSLGFPTANVQYWPGKIIPSYGVYATWIWIGNHRLPSVTGVGVRPTFDNPPVAPRVETYIMDFNEDIYDQSVRVEFLEFLRPELRYDSVQSLINQMEDDTRIAREVLSHAD